MPATLSLKRPIRALKGAISGGWFPLSHAASGCRRRAHWVLPLIVSVTASWEVRGNLTFNFSPEPGTPQQVVDGLNAAAAQWSTYLGNSIAVNIDVGWQAMAAGVLGQTTYGLVRQDYGNVVQALNTGATSADDRSAYAHLQSGTTVSRLINHTTDNPNGANSATPYVNSLAPVSMTRANAKALGFLPASSTSDAAIRFNSSMPFDFNPADGTSGYDFRTVAIHEIGHTLGFISVVNQIEQTPGAAADLPPTILDLFRFSAASLAAGPGLIDNTADLADKYFSVDGGATAVAQFARGALYGGGYQADHWREFTFTGVMDAQTFAGLARSIRPTDLRAFDVLGYTIPEPGTGALFLAGLFLLRRQLRRNA